MKKVRSGAIAAVIFVLLNFMNSNNAQAVMAACANSQLVCYGADWLTVSGTISNTDLSNTARAGTYWDRWQLSGATGQEVSFYLGGYVSPNCSGALIDPFIQVTNAAGTILGQNDDGGGGGPGAYGVNCSGTYYDSYLTISNWNDSYDIRATTYSGGAVGAYKLYASVGTFFTQINSNKTAQSITFATLSTKTFGAPNFVVSASATSLLAVAFTSQTAGVCTVDSATVTLVTAGTCTIRASQAGNATYAVAPNVDRDFTVQKATRTLNIDSGSYLSSYTILNSPPTITSTPSAGTATGKSYTSSTPSYCTVNSDTGIIAFASAGICTISAAITADTSYSSANSTSISFTINKAAQAALSVVSLYQPFFSNPTSTTLLVTGGSDTGTVSYAYVPSLSTAGGCVLSGANNSIITVTSEGTCRIVATKAATDNYLAAVSDTGTVTFHLYISNFGTPRAQEYPSEIVLVGGTDVVYQVETPPVISSASETTQAEGGLITLTGSGFTGTTSVKIKGLIANFVVNSDTSLTLTVPTGLAGRGGRIVVENAMGISISETLFTFTAPASI